MEGFNKILTHKIQKWHCPLKIHLTEYQPSNFCWVFFIFTIPQPAKKMTIRQRDKNDMNIYTAISLGIAIAGFIGGIIVKVADLSSKYGRLQEKVKNNEDRDTEERHNADAKFAELYNRMSVNESSVNALQTNVNNLTATCNRIESKLDRIIEREAK